MSEQIQYKQLNTKTPEMQDLAMSRECKLNCVKLQ